MSQSNGGDDSHSDEEPAPLPPDYYELGAVDQISLCHRNETDKFVEPLNIGIKLGHNFENYSGIADAIVFNVGLCVLLMTLGLIYWRVIHKHIIEGGTSVKRAFKNLLSGFLPDRWRANFHDERTTFNIYWFTLNKTFLKRSYGVEGMQYLCFQRYVIGLLVVINMLTLSIVLPLNVTVGADSKATYRLQTSLIENLDVNSNFLWIHLVLGWCFIPISMYFMHLYCDKILSDYYAKNEKSLLTLHVSRLPIKLRRRTKIRQWFKQKYPFAKVKAIYLTYETSNLLNLYRHREMLQLTLQKCEKDTKLYRRQLCGGYKNGPGEAIAAYRKQLKVNGKTIKSALKDTKKKPLDSAYVTLKSHDHAKFIVECEKMASISERATFCSNGIKITFAPPTDNIEWVNMKPRRLLRCRRLIIIIVLTILVFFFTTPQAILIYASHAVDAETHKTGLLQGYKKLTSILKLLTRIVINSIFTSSMKFMGFWKQLDINRNILRMTTAYLLLVLLFLPTFEFLNIKDIFAFSKELTDEHFKITKKKQHHWDCIFKEQGIIVFIHFIITTAFLGSALEYLRPGDMVNTVLDWLISRSWPEVLARIETRRAHFWFGEAYSLELLYLTITIGLCISTPIITPLGLMFYLIKHCLSTYNLKFNRKQYIFTHIGSEFHNTEVSYVIGATVCLQWYNALVFNLKKAASTLGFTAAFMAMASTIFLLIGISSKWKYPIPIVRPAYRVIEKDVVQRKDPYLPYYLEEFKSHMHDSKSSHA